MNTSYLTIKRPIANLSDNILGYVDISFWQNIQNASELLGKVTSRTPSEVFQNTIILNAEMIYSQAHLMVALQRAFLNFKLNQMKMRTLGTELLYFLSPFPNIKESFRIFGLGPDTHHIVVLRILNEANESMQDTSNVNPCFIIGTLSSVSQLGTVCNVEQICSTYKLPFPKLTVDASSNNRDRELELSLIEKIAVKGLL